VTRRGSRSAAENAAEAAERVEAALDEDQAGRAQRARDEGDDAPAWIAVRIGDAEFGIGIERVREVLPPPEVTRVPMAPPSVLGVVSVRREVVPVVDLGRRLLERPAEHGRLVVVSHGEPAEPVGLLVDAVVGLIGRHAVREEPTEPVAAALDDGLMTGVVRAGGRSVALLDLDRVLDVPLREPEEAR